MVFRIASGFFLVLLVLTLFSAFINWAYDLPDGFYPADTLPGLLGAPFVAVIGFIAGYFGCGRVQSVLSRRRL